MAEPNMLFNDGYSHQYTIYLLNGSILGSTGEGYNGAYSNYNVIQNPYPNLRVPVSNPSSSGVTIQCNIHKPIYVWVRKGGNIRYYPFINSTINNKSTLHVENKNAHTHGDTNENSGIIVDINGKEFTLETNGVQICSVENPDYEDISGWNNNINIRIKQYKSSIQIPAQSFGIGISFYEQHSNPARDPDKYIVH